MMDAHFHRSGETLSSLGGRDFRFVGIHPWNAENADTPEMIENIRSVLGTDPSLGVGEIGLDRLKTKAVSPAQRKVFEVQLEIAADMGRPVVLHGAKCWGEVVKAAKPYAGRIPAFLFHGFSRSDGLLPDIVAMNGYVGVGKAVLNDHAVNYRELVKKIPRDRLLVETDCDGCPEEERVAMLESIRSKTLELVPLDAETIEANAAAFLRSLLH